MDTLVIEGGKKLSGSIQVGGAKNAALPILFAAILTGGRCRLTNVPDLADIDTTVRLLTGMGVTGTHRRAEHTVELQAARLSNFEASYDLVRTMRASVLVLGPTLARFGEARVSLPGGCSIGARPVNLHLMALEKMGAQITLEGGYINAKASRLRGADITFDQISVGATENSLMAASLASGRTILRNCALEPEIIDLARFLKVLGAKIQGEGTPVITIEGVDALGGGDYSIIPDRIEAGTYLAAAAVTGGEIHLPGVSPELLGAVLDKLRECGAELAADSKGIRLSATGRQLKAVDISTLPFPGFPTDMQAQFMALMAATSGTSIITENIFENRFMHVAELMRLGADITVQGATAIVRGPAKLTGATVMATDLRASACLVLAGLAAEGITTVRRVYHLDRGYEKMETKLKACGATINRQVE
ncbi:MAG: UDP-N-acetylglucosamine 1-carboxyvinyltransferase [Deltaproteobacteria bacterium]|nr:UDP-N-acetylglucosamine 1-carboxyvinyltransferase [Deltaproteobacteria bacterium]